MPEEPFSWLAGCSYWAPSGKKQDEVGAWDAQGGLQREVRIFPKALAGLRDSDAYWGGFVGCEVRHPWFRWLYGTYRPGCD